MTRVLIVFAIVGSFVCWGQQSPQYSQYVRNQYMVNPAATGAYDFVSVNLGGRAQWVGIDGSPKTSYLYFAAPVNKLSGASMKRTFGKVARNKKKVRHPNIRRGKIAHAFGGHLLADEYGAFRSLKFMGTYAVHLPLNNAYNLSFGTRLGLTNRSFLSEKAQVLTMMTNSAVNDATYASYMSHQGAQNTMDIEAGLYFYGDDAFMGVSANQLTKDLVRFGNTNINFDPRTHFFITGGYRFHLNRRIDLIPAVLLKYVKPAPLSFETTVQLDFNERFWTGLSYRHEDAVVAMVGATISNSFRIGYSYDFSISRFMRYTSGGHELVLGLMLGRSRNSAVKFN